MTKAMFKSFAIQEFRIEDLPISCTCVFIAPPGYGKTSMIETLMYRKRHLYPVARAWIGTDTSYMRFCKILGRTFVSNYYDETEHRSSISRQRTVLQENPRNYEGNRCITIIDDLSSDPKIYKSPLMRGTFKNGSQHWEQLFMLGMQYAIDMPPDVRLSISYVFIGRVMDVPEREKIYKNFCGIIPREYFDAILDEICHDHVFLVIKRRSQSNNWLDNVGYLKTEVLPEEWRFGCKEYIEWDKKRYNSAYKERTDF